MKKYLFATVFVFVALPGLTFAAWWNPLDWFSVLKKKPQPAAVVVAVPQNLPIELETPIPTPKAKPSPTESKKVAISKTPKASPIVPPKPTPTPTPTIQGPEPVVTKLVIGRQECYGSVAKFPIILENGVFEGGEITLRKTYTFEGLEEKRVEQEVEVKTKFYASDPYIVPDSRGKYHYNIRVYKDTSRLFHIASVGGDITVTECE